MSFFCFCFTVNKKVYLTEDSKKYYIPKSIPTEKEVMMANNSWNEIISLSAAGYKRAKYMNVIGPSTSPISFFYDTFFNIWKNKNNNIVNDIYKNNIKIQSKSMISMVTFILNCNMLPSKSWEKIIEHHKHMGVTTDHLFLMGDVLIETIMIVLHTTDIDNEIIYAWRVIISYAIDKMTQNFMLSLSEKLSSAAAAARSRTPSPNGSPKVAPKTFSPPQSHYVKQSSLFNVNRIDVPQSPPPLDV